MSRWLDRALIISPVYYCLCVTEKQFRKELKQLNVDRKDWPEFQKNSHANATAHFFINDGKTCCIVCLGSTKNRTRSEVHGLLIHEAVHIWQEVRSKMGENLPSTEFEAYSIQTIAQRLIEAYGK